MKIINLLPKSEQKEVKLQFFAHSLLVFWLWALISIFVFLILTLLAKNYLVGVQIETANASDQQREILKSSDNEILKQQVSSLNQQINSIKNLKSQHVYWSKALSELANLFAFDIHMDLISIDRATGKVDVQGTAGSRESVLKFWADIHKSAYFKDINFPLSNLERATDDSFTFTFYANLDKLKTE